jgi:hypothetical protein
LDLERVMAAPVFRTYREGDEVAINRLFEEASGLVRSLDEWSWLYPPEADGRAIIVAETGGDVVGHCAGTPLRVAVDERELAAARIDDLFSPAPGDEIAERIAESFFENFSFPGRFSLVVACRRSPDDAIPPGFDEAPSRELTVLTRDRVPHLRVRRLLYRAVPARDWEPRLDDLWHRVRQDYPVAVVRDAEGALRRFAGHPTARYQRFLIFPRFSSQAVAFVVFRCDGGRCRWVDFLWDHSHPGALELAAHISARLVRQLDCTGEELWLAGDEEARSRLEGLGFRAAEEQPAVSVAIRSFDPEINATQVAERLYLTMADTGRV